MLNGKPFAIAVDDDTEVLSLLSEFLKAHGFIVKDFHCPVLALQYLKTNDSKNIDLILTDFNMPRLNGFELMLEVEQINPNIPIVMVSANGHDNEFSTEATAKGAVYILCKPFSLNDFNIMLNSLTKAKKY
jgi:CheY-like chemotaxis protein